MKVGSCAEPASFHSATSDARHEIDYLASKKGNLFQKLNGWPALSSCVCERVFFTSTFAATDDDLDEDYCPGAKSKLSKKKKSWSSRKLPTSSVRSSKRVRLASLMAGLMMDSSGDEYDPPTISASKTLESRYSCIFLVASIVLCRE